ncbi:MAG: CfrBI family restriction endonuclease [Clostridiales bacterium]|jgi:hypothetical protein|nr:CfrBI family restriction endonuclease [Clostridiales bacterium]
MTFDQKVINDTVEKLIKGEDHRSDIFRYIDVQFFEFSISFFKEIVRAKFDSKSIDYSWYKTHFLTKDNLVADIAMYGCSNIKSIHNIKKSSTKEIVLAYALENIEYIERMLCAIEGDLYSEIGIQLILSYNNIKVELSLVESLLIINVLATKKIQTRGGAWSSIGKKVEKPLLDKLCELAKIPQINIDNSHFVKDKTKDFDREVDYKLISDSGIIYRIEVKLMGSGNPESADATIARDSNIFVADTLSQQNKNQLTNRGVKWLELKNNNNTIADFKTILAELDIPHQK